MRPRAAFFAKDAVPSTGVVPVLSFEGMLRLVDLDSMLVAMLRSAIELRGNLAMATFDVVAVPRMHGLVNHPSTAGERLFALFVYLLLFKAEAIEIMDGNNILLIRSRKIRHNTRSLRQKSYFA